MERTVKSRDIIRHTRYHIKPATIVSTGSFRLLLNFRASVIPSQRRALKSGLQGPCSVRGFSPVRRVHWYSLATKSAVREPTTVLQAQMRHADVRTTLKVYAHVIPKSQRESGTPENHNFQLDFSEIAAYSFVDESP